MKAKKFIQGVLYRAKRGHTYDPNEPSYNCYIATATGYYEICDCWVADSGGNIHPGYCNSPVPVAASCLGEAIENTLAE